MLERQRKKKKKKYPFLSISFHFGIGATIRIGRESQCLPYAGFLAIPFISSHIQQFKLSFGKFCYVCQVLLGLAKLSQVLPSLGQV